MHKKRINNFITFNLKTESNDILRAQMFSIVENQLERNDSPETKHTLNRLHKEGWSKDEAKQLIAQCIAFEIFGIMKNQEVFNEKRFRQNLKNLPQEPTE